jgi:hypothetical protein
MAIQYRPAEPMTCPLRVMFRVAAARSRVAGGVEPDSRIARGAGRIAGILASY